MRRLVGLGILPALLLLGGCGTQGHYDLGEHNDEVFAALGVSEQQRQALRTRGVT